MQKRQILINAIMSVLQIVVIGGILFVLYRFLLNTIGIKQLGVWSLVLATTSVTQIANLGLSGSVVKFVAKYIARQDFENVSGVIQTAAISASVLVGLVLLIGYPFARQILDLVIPDESLPSALGILPYAFLALWSMVITSVFQAGLDGYQRIDLRSLLLIVGASLNLILCFVLAPLYGLMGVAYARVIQNFTILISSWLLLRRYLPLLPIFPYKWNKSLFKEIVGYGINFQVIFITTMFYDPTTKALLSKFGGLSMVGYYEMASRMIQQFRALIVSANQVLVPAIADLKEKIPYKIESVYLISYQLLFYLSLLLFSLIVICTPIISQLWIGHYERVFVSFVILLVIGWFFNTLNAPAYFANLGIGELSWNVIGHVTIGVLNIILGLLLGVLYNGIGVVIAWVVSLAFGSSIIILSYHITHEISLTKLLPESSRIIIAASLFGILTGIITHYKLNNILNAFLLNSIIIFLFAIIVFIPFWIHPMRKLLIEWINGILFKKEKEMH
jgi:O-antigen/teichoic acid export membrane protein